MWRDCRQQRTSDKGPRPCLPLRAKTGVRVTSARVPTHHSHSSDPSDRPQLPQPPRALQTRLHPRRSHPPTGHPPPAPAVLQHPATNNQYQITTPQKFPPCQPPPRSAITSPIQNPSIFLLMLPRPVVYARCRRRTLGWCGPRPCRARRPTLFFTNRISPRCLRPGHLSRRPAPSPFSRFPISTPPPRGLVLFKHQNPRNLRRNRHLRQMRPLRQVALIAC